MTLKRVVKFDPTKNLRFYLPCDLSLRHLCLQSRFKTQEMIWPSRDRSRYGRYLHYRYILVMFLVCIYPSMRCHEYRWDMLRESFCLCSNILWTMFNDNRWMKIVKVRLNTHSLSLSLADEIFAEKLKTFNNYIGIDGATQEVRRQSKNGVYH